MRVLLDSSAWLWMVAASHRLGEQARAILTDSAFDDYEVDVIAATS